MKSTKEKVLEKFPELKERVYYRLKPVGRKGYATLEGVLELTYLGQIVSTDTSTKRAYSKANIFLSRR